MLRNVQHLLKMELASLIRHTCLSIAKAPATIVLRIIARICYIDARTTPSKECARVIRLRCTSIVALPAVYAVRIKMALKCQLGRKLVLGVI